MSIIVNLGSAGKLKGSRLFMFLIIGGLSCLCSGLSCNAIAIRLEAIASVYVQAFHAATVDSDTFGASEPIGQQNEYPAKCTSCLLCLADVEQGNAWQT